MKPTADVPIWRRDCASPQERDASTSSRAQCDAPVSPSARRPKKSKRKPLVTLLPITPLHEVAPGRLDVNEDQARVVYLAPITSTSAAKYFSRTKHRSREESDSGSDVGEGDNADADDAQQVKDLAARSPITSTLRKLIAQEERRKSFRNGGVARPSLLYSDISGKSPAPARDRDRDDQLERFRQHVHSMPTSEQDKAEFWQAMKSYQRLKIKFKASVSQSTESVIAFNMQAAWNRELLHQRHQLWIQAHDTRVEECRVRKMEEDEKYEQRVLESTTEHRAQIRLLREVRMRLTHEAVAILPSIMLAAATQNWLSHLQSHWRAQHLRTRLRGIIRFWCKKRASRSSNERAAFILINWLQKSVAVKSVAFRVFRGIRNYVRKVKVLQRLWKIKQAKRRLNLLLLERMWATEETALVDRANDDFERQQHKVVDKRVPVLKKKKSKALAPTQSNEKWLTFVDPGIRIQVLQEFVIEKEREFRKLFRQQEEELFPHLVQTLRGENPDRARSYIKAMATNFALLGRVHTTLCGLPGAVDGVSTVQPFDMHKAPIRQLILKGRDRSPADPTGARFGSL